MTRRYFFACPDVSGASGGVAVIYACVEKLRAAGYDAVILHTSPGYRYAGTPYSPPIHYSRRIAGVQLARLGRRRMLDRLNHRITETLRPLPDEIGPDDVVVVPEYLIRDVVQAFPGQPTAVFSQNSFSYLRSFGEARAAGYDPDADVIFNLVISDTCEEATRLMSGRPCARVTVCPNLALFPFISKKMPKICFMPRKRPDEAKMIREALERRGRIGGFDVVAIDGFPQEQVARIMGESLIFVSLMHHEALGFPGIEAMAAGCLVIGYTGLGTREYFDSTTGIPVTEGDTVGVVKAVEDAVQNYLADPTALDAMRHRASNNVRARYNDENFTASLLAAWERIEAASFSAAKLLPMIGH